MKIVNESDNSVLIERPNPKMEYLPSIGDWIRIDEEEYFYLVTNVRKEWEIINDKQFNFPKYELKEITVFVRNTNPQNSR